MKNPSEERRERYDQYQAKFDLFQEEKREKLLWIENVIMPMLDEDV
jgi:hypothetical protein